MPDRQRSDGRLELVAAIEARLEHRRGERARQARGGDPLREATAGKTELMGEIARREQSQRGRGETRNSPSYLKRSHTCCIRLERRADHDADPLCMLRGRRAFLGFNESIATPASKSRR